VGSTSREGMSSLGRLVFERCLNEATCKGEAAIQHAETLTCTGPPFLVETLVA
jgi:hypothetical protein